MKAWNFKLKSKPQEIGQKLDAALGPANGFVFKMHHGTNDSITFKVRKRYLTPIHNSIFVNGKVLRTGHKNESTVKITFAQHLFILLQLYGFIAFGLVGIIAGIITGTYMSVFGGLLFAFGILMLIDARKKFGRNVQQYQTLISEILELPK